MYSKELAELGFVVFRRENEVGGLKPHLFIRFKSKDGRLLTFAIDTTRFSSSRIQPDAYFITHAHADHYGKSAMLSDRSWCSEETACALEIRYEKTYKGRTFHIGDCFSVCGVDVQTFDVCHAPGSSAFYWENELGNSILVTGDVKDARFLPECDVLVTEASYGDPADLGCYFEDDIEGLQEAVLSHIGKCPIVFGAYEFGKSQKAVSLLRSMGYNGPIAMNDKTLELTRQFVPNAGELFSRNSSEMEASETFSFSRTQMSFRPDGASLAAVQTKTSLSYASKQNRKELPACDISIVPVHELGFFGAEAQTYVLTCRRDYPFESIRLSDHLDVNGLTRMVQAIRPQITIVYHPNKGTRTDRFARHLERSGFKAFSVNQIQNVVGNGKTTRPPQ